jgi:F0F1-type ATP synthase assembly protein I
MRFITKHKLTIAGIIAGAAAGYLYYHYTGCANGSCSITSHPVNGTIYGAMMGGLLLSVFQKKENK